MAADLATLMVVEFGMGKSLGHLHTRDRKEREQLRQRDRDVAREVSAILAGQLVRAEAIVGERLHAVETVAMLLEEGGTLTGEGISKLMSSCTGGRHHERHMETRC